MFCRQQLDAISFDSVKVNSVDGFQGQEKEVNQSWSNHYLVVTHYQGQDKEGKTIVKLLSVN